MPSIKIVTSCLLSLVLASTAYAKNVVYDLTNVQSFGGEVNYQRLNFNAVTSAVVNVSRVAGQPEPTITSLTVNFSDIAKLTATNFKKTPQGTYRAIVQGAWVFKEVIVDVMDNPIIELNRPLHIRVSVSERTAFINPVADAQGPILFEAFGQVHDITPTRVVDSANTVLSGKRVTLSLRDRLGSDDKNQFGFVMTALWYGVGTKTIILPWSNQMDVDNIDAYAIVIDSSNSTEPMVFVKFRDQFGTDVISPMVPLRAMMNFSFGGATPFPL